MLSSERTESVRLSDRTVFGLVREQPVRPPKESDRSDWFNSTAEGRGRNWVFLPRPRTPERTN